MIGNKRLKDTFGGIKGDSLTRPPRGFDADHPLIDHIKRKSFFAMRHEKPAVIFHDNFVDEVEKTFKAAKPLMKYICFAMDIPF